MNLLAALPVVIGFAPPAFTRHPQVPDSAYHFPAVEGTNLEGRRFTLPGDFEGEHNLVVVAFRREQQDDVDTWLPFLKETAAHESGLRVYELPTMGRRYRIIQGWIDGGMAKGIPGRATREATITLYIDKGPFKRSLGIASEDRIVTLLVSRDGRVLWREAGRFTPGAGAGLVATLDLLRSPRPTS